MKKILYFILTLLILSSCKHGDVDYVDFSQLPTRGKQFHILSESSVVVGEAAPWQHFEDEYGEWLDDGTADVNAKPAATSFTLTDVFREILDIVLEKKVHQVAGTYESVDLNGNEIQLSGKIFYPEDGICHNIILVSHYTIGADYEAPSNTFCFEGMYAALGYLVVEPDYLGFGVTADSIHPYLQAEHTASSVIDMAYAANAFIAERGIQMEEDSIILLGYSQGGATTMHVLRMLENDYRYKGDFKIEKTYAGAGPYDVAKTYDYSVKVDKTGIPCAVPMIIQGMSIGMAKPLDMAYFFKEPLLSNYKDWLNSKHYTVKQMNLLLNVDRLSEILTPNALDKTQDETIRFYRELKSNSIPTNFMPKSPLYMFHSEDDNTVPFVNSQLMQRQFSNSILSLSEPAPIEYDFDHYGNHMMGAIKFIVKAAKMLKK